MLFYDLLIMSYQSKLFEILNMTFLGILSFLFFSFQSVTFLLNINTELSFDYFVLLLNFHNIILENACTLLIAAHCTVLLCPPVFFKLTISNSMFIFSFFLQVYMTFSAEPAQFRFYQYSYRCDSCRYIDSLDIDGPEELALTIFLTQ